MTKTRTKTIGKGMLSVTKTKNKLGSITSIKGCNRRSLK